MANAHFKVLEVLVGQVVQEVQVVLVKVVREVQGVKVLMIRGIQQFAWQRVRRDTLDLLTKIIVRNSIV